MTVTAEDIMRLSYRLQQDLRDASAKLTTLRAMLATLSIPTREQSACPRCGIGTGGPGGLADHLENVHGGGSA